MTEVKFSEWIQKAFDLYKANLATLLVVWLLVAVLGSLTMGILAGPMMCGGVLVTLALLDGKEPKPEIGDVFKGFNFFLQALLCGVVIFAVTFFAGLILNFIPIIGPVISTLFSLTVDTFVMFAFFHIAERNMEFVPAIKASIETVKTNFWPFLGYQVVASAIAGIGFVACCVGIFLTIPVYGCMMAVAYRDVYGKPAVAQPPA